MDKMSNILNDIVEKKAIERSKWIDQTIIDNVPKWKLDFIKKFNYSFLKTLIRADIEIIYRDLIGNFGTSIIIRLNKKIIGERKFKNV